MTTNNDTKKKSLKQTYNEWDNRVTYVIGHRNLINIAVLFVSVYGMAAGAEVLHTGAESVVTVTMTMLIMFVLGLKWFFDQTVENIDATDVYDAIDKKEG